MEQIVVRRITFCSVWLKGVCVPNGFVQPPFRKAIKSERSFALAMPAKAMAFPGAKSAGPFSHLSRLPSVHLRVALAARADE